jgi:hypothetical protein
MTTTSLDLFGESDTSGAPASVSQGMPASITATSSGQPPEWGPYALDIVFAGRTSLRKSLSPSATADLVRAMWDYALARHEALMARRSAGSAAASLLGHRSNNDRLALALRVIESHRIEVGIIPPAREFGPQFDLRHLAGTSPFPIKDEVAP